MTAPASASPIKPQKLPHLLQRPLTAPIPENSIPTIKWAIPAFRMSSTIRKPGRLSVKKSWKMPLPSRFTSTSKAIDRRTGTGVRKLTSIKSVRPMCRSFRSNLNTKAKATIATSMDPMRLSSPVLSFRSMKTRKIWRQQQSKPNK